MNRLTAIIVFIVLLMILAGMVVIVIKKPKGSYSKPAAILCIAVSVADLICLIIVGKQVFFPKDIVIEIGNSDSDEETVEDYTSSIPTGEKAVDAVIIRGGEVLVNGVDIKDEGFVLLREHLDKQYRAEKEVVVIDYYADFETYYDVINVCKEIGVQYVEKDEKWLKE